VKIYVGEGVVIMYGMTRKSVISRAGNLRMLAGETKADDYLAVFIYVDLF